MSAFADGCDLCARARGDAEPVGGWVLRNGPWTVGAGPGFEAPGWMFVELHSRHAEGPWSLTPDEAASLGPLLSRVSSAVRDVTGAERVYWIAFGEVWPHFHMLLLPRLPDTPADMRGPALFLARDQFVNAERAASVAGQLRDVMG